MDSFYLTSIIFPHFQPCVLWHCTVSTKYTTVLSCQGDWVKGEKRELDFGVMEH